MDQPGANGGGSSAPATISGDNIPIPKPGSFSVDPGLSNGVSSLISIGSWVVFALCVAGVLLCAARMAIAHKNGGEVAVVGLLWAMAACMVAGTASGVVGMVVK